MCRFAPPTPAFACIPWTGPCMNCSPERCITQCPLQDWTFPSGLSLLYLFPIW